VLDSGRGGYSNWLSEIKEKVYITSGPEFGANLHAKNLIIEKSLYGFKTSIARFHEHLVESVLRLGFKKSNHDPDFGWWTSHDIMNT
jgi:predicted fused transcriptional regulator/phosphomethylpyrimidine kinase